MMKVLLKNQRKLILNAIKSQSRSNFISYLLSFIVVGVLLIFLGRGVLAVGESITEPVLLGILGYGFLVSIVFIILLSVPQVFKHLYAATDLGLLFTLPIPTRHIFWIKYLQSFIGIPLLIFVFLAVLLVIYGILVDASLIFYPVSFFVLLALMVIALSLAYLINLVLIQIIPASKVNELLMPIVSVVAGLFGYLTVMIPNMANEGSIVDSLLAGLPLFPDWVPVTWACDAIVYAMNGTTDLLLPFILLMVLAILMVSVTSMLVEKGFRTGWIRLSEGGGKKKKKQKAAKRGQRTTRHPVIAIGKKEWFAIKRDMREWVIFLPISFIIIIPLISLFSSGSALSDLQGFNEISWPIAQIVFLFIYAIFNGQLAAFSIGREGVSVWILRTLPLTGRDIALGKLWISWVLPFILLTVLEVIIGILLGWTITQFIIGVAVKAAITIGISAIGLWLGTTGSKYNPSNPQQRVKFGTAILLMVVSYVYLFVALVPYVLLVIPGDVGSFLTEISTDLSGFFGAFVGLFATLLSWKASYPALMIILGIVAMLIVSLGVAALFTSASGRRIDKGLEIEIVNESNAKALFKNKKSGGSLY
ncbi:ABC-2 type transport system permease protein [Virgibacillus natechei]|uniref:ABC-2 type transport system permease protein n=1 Tax=Virgibacillus natechei TaxID=1216297 RepID=A0ABS4IHW7_9BACI|nr:hypothetical protein [Virgibacillus natechei]MBP1970547.1 ABC-2 type transport system permease protein [Virgibacillus natechei]UZD14052.1 hypothetical protein OLD84_05910 [Virgibacillus natechei]